MSATALRVRTRVPEAAIREHLAGKVLGPADYDVLLTGAARVAKPDGKPLAVFMPGVLGEYAQDPAIYAVLHSLRTQTTENRGLASGTRRISSPQKRSYAKTIASAIVGAVDPMGQQKYCRLTSWTGRNLPEWQLLAPLLRAVAAHLEREVPDRYATQAAHAARTDPAWVVPGTPFTTITVNNTYPTGAHTDKGDLAAGFSTIACLRRGTYIGGQLVFPAYRVAVDLHDGDLLLMDAHEWHGNTAIICTCGTRLNGCCEACGAERVSVVSYFREKMTACGSPAEEQTRAEARAAARGEHVDQQQQGQGAAS